MRAVVLQLLAVFTAVQDRRGLLEGCTVIFYPYICVLALPAVFQEDNDSCRSKDHHGTEASLNTKIDIVEQSVLCGCGFKPEH